MKKLPRVPDGYLTTKEVAARYHRVPSMPVIWIQRGLLPAVRHGRLWVVSEKDLVDFVPPRERHNPRPHVVPDGYLNKYQAAQRSGFAAETIAEWCYTGELRSRRGCGGMYLLAPADLDAVAVAHKPRGAYRKRDDGGSDPVEVPTEVDGIDGIDDAIEPDVEPPTPPATARKAKPKLPPPDPSLSPQAQARRLALWKAEFG